MVVAISTWSSAAGRPKLSAARYPHHCLTWA